MVTTRSAGERDDLIEVNETTRLTHDRNNPETQEDDLAAPGHTDTSPAPVSTGYLVGRKRTYYASMSNLRPPTPKRTYSSGSCTR
jgi:hypothetical protein